MKTNIILAALLAAAFAVTPSAAQAQQPAARMVVSYHDLDLGSAAGRRMLDLRIAQAVNDLCGEASSADLRGQNGVRACRTALRADARAQRDTAFAAWRRNSPTALAARR